MGRLVREDGWAREHNLCEGTDFKDTLKHWTRKEERVRSSRFRPATSFELPIWPLLSYPLRQCNILQGIGKARQY